MLRVQRNRCREYLEINGLWDFIADPDNNPKEFHLGIEARHQLAIPGSWNEQLQEAGYLNYTGTVYLQKRVFVPTHFKGR